MTSTPTPADIKAAQRGLNMLAMPPAYLRDVIDMHKDNPAFASRAITMAARQMLAVKLRNGAAD